MKRATHAQQDDDGTSLVIAPSEAVALTVAGILLALADAQYVALSPVAPDSARRAAQRRAQLAQLN